MSGYVVVGALPTVAALYLWRVIQPGIAATLLMLLNYWPSFLAPVIAPALTAGAIAGERERRTWDLLVVTRLTPAEIVWGKLLSRLMLLVWLTIPLVPLVAVLAIRGGGAIPWLGPGMGGALSDFPPAWVWTFPAWVSGLMVAFANAVMGLYVSMRCSNTRAALVIAYGVAVGASMLVSAIIGVLSMLVMVPLVMTSAGGFASGAASPAPPAFPAHSMIWMMAVQSAGPFLWGLVVPAVLLPVMVRGFARINSRVRVG